MTRLFRLVVFLIYTLTCMSINAQTNPGSAPEVTTQTKLQDLITDIFDRAGKENLLLNNLSKDFVESHVDFGEMAKDILGNDSKKRDTEELKWFEQAIKDIITQSVYPQAPKFLEHVKISFKKSQASEIEATISSVVSKKGEGTQVDYFFKKIGNDWKIVDVAIDEESWVKTINEKVQKTLKEKGWKGLKDLLSKRLNDLKKSQKNKDKINV